MRQTNTRHETGNCEITITITKTPRAQTPGVYKICNVTGKVPLPLILIWHSAATSAVFDFGFWILDNQQPACSAGGPGCGTKSAIGIGKVKDKDQPETETET